MSKVKVGIIGVSGYAGEELLRILISHPSVEITYLAAKIEEDTPVGKIFPQFSFLDLICYSQINLEEVVKKVEMFFLALPHAVSLKFVPKLYSEGKTIIDLSADYRFNQAKIYENYYVRHTSPHLLKEKIYGLPEIYRERIKGKKLIANPGCYPTSVILGLAPLLKEKLIIPDTVIVDAKSGVSGAGRNPRMELVYSEANEDIRAYAIASHRHQPEMEQELSNLSGEEVKVLFVPHLAPYNRGILSTIYVKLRKDLAESEIYEKYLSFYKREPFVKVLPLGEFPAVKYVRGTNLCLLGIKMEKRTRRLVIVSAIDNLTKGASGQAVQNFNILMGFPEVTALNNLPVLP